MPTQVFYSIGQNSTDHKTGSPTLTMSGGVAILTVAQTNLQLGIGDRITYDTTSIAYIKSMTSQTVFVLITKVGAAPGDEGSAVTVDSIAHEYTSLQAAESGSNDSSHLGNRNLVANDIQLLYPCYNDSGEHTGRVTYDNGWTTDATRNIVIFTPVLPTEANSS